LDVAAAETIAQRARRTPRVANRLLKRVRDFAEVEERLPVTAEVVCDAMNLLDVDCIGLDAMDRKILETLIEKFHGGPAGLQAIAAATAEEMETLETIYEPYLLSLGLIDRTPRGRVATARAYEHLGREAPQQQQLQGIANRE
jgi:Holliday junction DNA helicase RuvB